MGSGHALSRSLPLPLSLAGTDALAGGLALLIVAAALLRAIPWTSNYPLHHDEALYGYWARLILSDRDPLLLTTWIDKPPLVIYTLAGALAAFGVSDQALRVPGLLASVALIPCTWGFARRIYGGRIAWLAALLISLSPFAILFAPTAFTDPWLALWLVVAAWAAIGRRPFWAGLALGLAVASKQQGMLGVPLVAALLMMDRRPPTTDDRRPTADEESDATSSYLLPSSFFLLPSSFVFRPLSFFRAFPFALLGFAIIFVPITYWDSLRWATRPSFWDRSLTTYGGLGLATPSLWPARAAQWSTIAGYLFGTPIASALLLGLAAYAGLRDGRTPDRCSQHQRVLLAWGTCEADADTASGAMTNADLTPQTSSPTRRGGALTHPPPSQGGGQGGRSMLSRAELRHRDAAAKRLNALPNPISALLLAYIAGYLALHFFLTFQPWDRYLLPILPFICVLAARGIELARMTPAIPIVACHSDRKQGLLRSSIRLALGLIMVALLGWGAWLGVAARLPVGSDHGAYAGLDRIAAFLRSQPADAVIYDRWLGWHLDFYLFDQPQTRRWWGSGWKLAGDAARTYQETPARAQWLILPGFRDESAAEVRLALASRNLTLSEFQRLYRADGSRAFTVYRIIPVEGFHGG